MSELDSSLAAAIAEHAASRPAAPAVRYKARGRWRAMTWAALDAEVTLLARGLVGAGVRRGQRVWLVGSPGPRLLAFLFAVERVGAVPVPVDGVSASGSSVTISDVRHRTTGERTRQEPTAPVAFVENGEALDALAALIPANGDAEDDRPPTRIVFDDPRGLRASADERLQAYESFRGAAASPRLEPRRRAGGGSVRVLLLPLAWGDDALAVIRLWARSSLELCLTERQGNLDADLREVAPRVLLGAATGTAGLLARALERLPATGTGRRRFIDGSLATATRGAGVARKLARALVVRPLRRVLGLHRTRLALVVGPELAGQARALLEALGIRLSVVGAAFDDRSSGARVISLPLERTPARGAAGTTWREAIVP